MRKIGFFAIVMMIALKVSAQTESGDIFIGGAFQFSSNNTKVTNNGTTDDLGGNSSFTISPRAGYFISDAIAVGASLGFTTSKNEDGNGDYSSNNLFNLGPFARYYYPLNEQINFYGHAGASLGFGGSKVSVGNTVTDTGDIFNLNVGLRAGVAFFPAEKVNIDFGFNIINLNTSTNTNPNTDIKASSNAFNFGFNSLSPQLGVNFFF